MFAVGQSNYKKPISSPSFPCADRGRRMHLALWLFFNRSSGFACEMGMLVHPGTLVGHGSLLVPHPGVSLDSVKVMSWSRIWPHVMVAWLNGGTTPPTSSDVLTNTLLLIVRGFFRRTPLEDLILGPSPFWKAAGKNGQIQFRQHLWLCCTSCCMCRQTCGIDVGCS